MDLQNTRLKIAIQNITQLSPTEFTLARKAAFGGSDTGVLTGVNPYQTLTYQDASSCTLHKRYECEKQHGIYDLTDNYHIQLSLMVIPKHA